MHPAYGTLEDFQRLPRARRTSAACASSPSWSSTTRPISTRGSRRAPRARRLAEARLLRLERHDRNATRAPASSSRTSRPSNWTWDPVAERLLLASLLPPSARSQLRQPARPAARSCKVDATSGSTWASTACGSMPCRTSSSAKAPTARTCRRRTRSSRSIRARASTRAIRTACCWPKPISGRPTCVAYFGDGDECHMAFHFPLMPRMFMALAQEDRFPIIDILQQTPDDPRARASGRCSCATTTS